VSLANSLQFSRVSWKVIPASSSARLGLFDEGHDVANLPELIAHASSHYGGNAKHVVAGPAKPACIQT